jgi:uncharacterized protein (DUF4415 family)
MGNKPPRPRDQGRDDGDPGDAPPFTIGGKVVREADRPMGKRRGRPPKPEGERKEMVSLRLSSDGLAWLRTTGPGWQTRLDDMLRVKMLTCRAAD